MVGSPMELPDGIHSVVIVGAGCAGLSCARELLPRFPDLLCVEASGVPGGRIRQVEGVAPWPLELGPEFVHGARSALVALLRKAGFQFRERAWPDRWYYGLQRRLITADQQGEDAREVHALMADIGSEPLPDEDVSVADWLRARGASPHMLAVADACYANDFGCSLDLLGLTETILENRRWDAGEEYLLCDRSLRHLVAFLAEGLGPQLRVNWPVVRIAHDHTGATLWGPDGERLRARHVVITVPLQMLKSESITFSPALPEAKREAMSRLRMSNAVKVFLVFSAAFWPDDLFDVVCTDSFLPEFWVTSYPPVPTPDSPGGPAGQYVVTGFAAGTRAEEMSQYREGTIIIKALKQLDAIFGTKEAPMPATSNYVRGYVADWARMPHIGGAYSYPSLGARVGDREALAAPIGKTLFFAGEATHSAINPCLQAAMETGVRAAAEVLAATGERSRL